MAQPPETTECPVTELAAQLGHAKKSLTLDTYSHVLVDSR